jgi:aminoglycoside 6'-N-acetyltransferase I
MQPQHRLMARMNGNRLVVMNDEPASPTGLTVMTCTSDNLGEWAAMRAELWPDGSVDEHQQFAQSALEDPTRLVAFIAHDADSRPLGFAEASLRFDYVNGCSTSPVGFLEGLYVREDARRNGIARGLVTAVEHWAIACGCTELASDALIENETSHHAHRGLGFAEAERVVFFRKDLETVMSQ